MSEQRPTFITTDSHGPQLAKPAAMQDDKTVRLVKQYDIPAARTKATLAESDNRLKLEIQILRQEIAELKDQRRRLHEEIHDTIKMLTLALEENREETVEQVKRRISRLKGSLEYKGRYDFVSKER